AVIAVERAAPIDQDKLPLLQLLILRQSVRKGRRAPELYGAKTRSAGAQRAVCPVDETLDLAGTDSRRQYPRRAPVEFERHRLCLPHQREFGRRFDHAQTD